MLEIVIPKMELYDESKNEFINVDGVTLRLEHSLVSLSKWESEWKIPFLVEKPPKTQEQTLDYIRCMTINQNVDPNVYKLLNNEQLNEIINYIAEERTATKFYEQNPRRSNTTVTSELIYFWMAQFNIPMECQKWHLSRLLTLIRIASIKNSPDKKMSKQAILSQNSALNAARRKAHNTKG